MIEDLPVYCAFFSLVWFNMLTSLAVIIAIPASGSGQLASHKFVWTEVNLKIRNTNSKLKLVIGRSLIILAGIILDSHSYLVY